MKHTFKFKGNNIIFELVNAAIFYSQFKIVAKALDEIKIVDDVGTSYRIMPDRIVIENQPEYLTPSIIETIVYDNCDEIQSSHQITFSRYELRYIQDVVNMLNEFSFNMLRYTTNHTQTIVDTIARAAMPNESYEIIATDPRTIEIKHSGKIIRIWDNRIVTTISLDKSLMKYIHKHCVDISGTTTITLDADILNKLIVELKAQPHDIVAVSILKTIEKQIKE